MANAAELNHRGAMPAKIFCIGFHKTGTTSLAEALELLGYRVTGPNGVGDPDIATNALKMALGLVPLYDAFQDNPWPILFRELDAAFPGSRFILTERPPEAWIRSVVNHFGSRSTPMRQWIYGEGAPSGNEALYLSRYNAHNEAVLAYFAGRPGDLLRLPITAGAGWTELCAFLGHAVPRRPFPHANARTAWRFKSLPGRVLRRFDARRRASQGRAP